MRILGASVGNCVHTGGVVNFLMLAEEHGYQTRFLGPATPVPKVIAGIREYDPDIVAISYRLTPETARNVLSDLREAVEREGVRGNRRIIFGGTPPVARVAKETGFFDTVFTGNESREEIVAFLKGEAFERTEADHAHNLVERIERKHPYPILRHHYGEPDLETTLQGMRKLAESRVLDVISIAPDQNAQEFFFRQDEMRPELDGGGGVCLRTPEDLRRIYEVTRTGNYPLLRCYSGTRDLVKWAAMLHDTIRIAWGAIPLFWYSRLDGRSNRPLEESIKENQEAMGFYASKGTPVEVNESHHWSLRESPDAVAVTAAFLAAYNAKSQGVRTYVAQYMFNTPARISPAMDLAKMLAKADLVEGLQDDGFRALRECRTGIMSLPLDMDQAKGHMGSSLHTLMAMRPHVVHVVAYTEANHHASADEIIESCKIAHGAIRNALLGLPDPSTDAAVQKRKIELLDEARYLLDRIREEADRDVDDPWTDPVTLARAVHIGILDAPQLMGTPAARGETMTRVVEGAWRSVDRKTGEVVSERERLKLLGIA